jgi:mannose-6-phosphate isomerase-like protein (cupin superfamily)
VSVASNYQGPANPSPDGEARVNASQELAADIQNQLEARSPVLKYDGRWVEEAARQKEGPLGLVVPSINEPYQTSDPQGVIGVTTDANASESARNPDKGSNRHYHWRASEWYLTIKGRMRLHAYLGRRQFTYEAGPGDLLYVRPGIPHKVEIDPDDGETLVYVFRAPAEATGYKQEWPPKTKP